MSLTICCGDGSTVDNCPESEIRQGESLNLSYSWNPPRQLIGFICNINVRINNPGQPDDKTLVLDKVLTELNPTQTAIVGLLTSGETNGLFTGDYWIAGELINASTGEAQESVCELTIIEQFVYPDTSQVEIVVSAFEANPTPETQAIAQAAVNTLPAGDDRDAFQARIDALDSEVALVETARLLVTAAETYPWTEFKRETAQDVVDTLISPIERAELTDRLNALTDEINASESVVDAEIIRTQNLINTAQGFINLIDPPENRVQLQDRLDDIVTYFRFVENGSDYSTIVNSYFLSQSGLRDRAVGVNGAVLMENTISSGWASVEVNYKLRQTFSQFVGVGNAANILAAFDQGSGDDTCVLTGDRAWYNGGIIGPAGVDVYIFVVDYRGVNPIVHIIDAGGNALIASQTLAGWAGPVSLVINHMGWKTNEERDYYFESNVGSDLANRPFSSDVVSILQANGVDTTGYTDGWGQNISLDFIPDPVLEFVTTPPPGITPGTPVSVIARAVGSDGIDRSSRIRWRNKFDNWLMNDNVIYGPEFTFTPTEYGYYELIAEFEDITGKIFEIETVMNVVGAVDTSGNLAFEPSGAGFNDSHPNVVITSAVPPLALNNIPNNAVTFGNATPFKKAAVGNIAIWGQYRYFEIKITNGVLVDGFGVGIMSLLCSNVAWSGGDNGDDPQEGAGGISILNVPSAGSTILSPWINGDNLTWQGDVGFGDGSNSEFTNQDGILGMAIDYRDTTQPPIIHVLHQQVGGIGTYLYSSRVWNCRTPIVPMVYVNNVSQNAQPDIVINGEEANMVITNAEALLSAAGRDVTDFNLFWGDDDAI